MMTIVRKNLKVIKTCDIYLSIFAVGLSVSLTGPCLLDLQKMIGTDTEHIALIYTSRSIGFLVGAIVGGIALDIIRSKFAVLAVCNLIVTITILGIPWCRSVSTLVALSVFNGLALGTLETGANVVCIELWGSGPYLQALHFAFGLGGLVSPIIAAPFLEYQNDIQTPSSNSSNFSDLGNIHSNFSSNSPQEGIPKVTYPFSIVGIFGLLVTTMFFVTILTSPTEDRKATSNKGNKSDRGWPFMVALVVFVFLAFFVISGSEIGFAQTLTSYAVKGPLRATATLGSYMTSSFWASFTMMRLVAVFLSVKVSNLVLIVVDILVVGVSGILLVFFMPKEWTLWAVCLTFGGGMASAYPSFVGLLGDNIEITNKISAIFNVGVAAGEMFYPFIIAYFMEVMPEMFVYVIVSTSILMLIMLLTLSLIFKFGSKSIKLKETECHDRNNEKVLAVTVS